MKKLSLALLPFLLASCSVFNPYGTSNIPAPSVVPNFAPQLHPHILWQKRVGVGSAGAYLHLAPTVSGSVIYTMDQKGLLSATTAEGVHLWDKIYSAGGKSDLASDMQAIAFVDAKAMLHVVSTDHATPLWTAQLSDQALAAPTITAELVISKTIDGYVTAFDRKTGKELWQYEHDAAPLSLRASSPVLVVGSVAYVGFADGAVVALNLTNGEVLWSEQAAEPQGFAEVQRMVDIDAHLLEQDGRLYVATYQGQITAFDCTTGKIIWQQANSVYADIALQQGVVYAVNADGTLNAYAAANGRLLWQQTALSWHFLTGPVFNQNSLVVGDGQGNLYFVNATDGTLLAQLPVYKKSAILNTPLLVNHALLVIDVKGSLSAVS